MISAIILAAGQSRRMGLPKMLLPWGNRKVLEHVVATFLEAGVEEIVIVTGAEQKQVEKAIVGYPVRTAHNSDYATGEMLSSLQCGLRELPAETQASLIGLGDQPQVREESIGAICAAYLHRPSKLIVPSFQMRRGHPWLIA